jgi:peroxiredoxin
MSLIPQVGDEAPDFSCHNEHGEQVRLSQLRGRNVLLVFYPFAFSGVCSNELAELRDALPKFAETGTEVLAVSCDPVYALRVWADAETFGFPLLSDFWPHGGIASLYGVFDAERGCAVRGTFVIDAGGVVRWSVVNALPDARNLEDYHTALAALG